MFYNPLFYGRKAEEVLWRKVFYDIIQLIKHNRRVSCEAIYRRRNLVLSLKNLSFGFPGSAQIITLSCTE